MDFGVDGTAPCVIQVEGFIPYRGHLGPNLTSATWPPTFKLEDLRPRLQLDPVAPVAVGKAVDRFHNVQARSSGEHLFGKVVLGSPVKSKELCIPLACRSKVSLTTQVIFSVWPQVPLQISIRKWASWDGMQAGVSWDICVALD